MKRISIFLFLLVLSVSIHANAIDKINTIGELNNFLEKVIPKYWEEVALDEKKPVPTEYGKNKFYKLDLDANGATDLVVDGADLFAITDDGNDKYLVHPIDSGAFSLRKYTLTNIISDGSSKILVIQGYDDHAKTQLKDSTEKKIIFKFGDFIEYNTAPDSFRLVKVVFKHFGCFGTCPRFDLDIQANRRATYNAIAYNRQKGQYSGEIDPESFKQIAETINYIRLIDLKDNYSVPWTDDQSSSLEITVEGKPVIKIRDYGSIGTFGLSNLYSQLANLRDSQKWTFVRKNKE